MLNNVSIDLTNFFGAVCHMIYVLIFNYDNYFSPLPQIFLFSGQKFAMLEMKSTISRILRNFEVLPAVPEHNLILISEAVLKSKNGMMVKLLPRKWK